MSDPLAPISLGSGVTARLDLSPIDNLIASALVGFRLFELFRLAGPQDLIHYVDVEIDAENPAALKWWPEWDIPDTPPPHRWSSSLQRPPWLLFGESISADEQAAWARSGLEDAARELAAARWPAIEAARQAVAAIQDPLVRYEHALILAGDHENDRALREPDLPPDCRRHFRYFPHQHFAASDYPLMADLLAHPAIRAFTHRGRGDWFAIKLACAEQWRRHGGPAPRDGGQFPIRVLSNWSGRSLFDEDDVRIALNERPSWTSAVRFQYEGLQREGLFLDEGGCGAQPMAKFERKELLDDVAVLLTNYAGDDRSPLRRWYRSPSGLLAGVLPALEPEFRPTLARHGLLLSG